MAKIRIDPASYDAGRRLVRDLVNKHDGGNLSAVSTQIGRSHSYLQQYLIYGSPEELREPDRIKLAARWGKTPDDFRSKPMAQVSGLSRLGMADTSNPERPLVANAIEEVRVSKGVSLDLLAELTGIPALRLRRIELGDPDAPLEIEEWVAIARALKVPELELKSSGRRPFRIPADAHFINPRETDSRPLLPIKSTGDAGEGGEIFVQEATTEFTYRSDKILYVEDAYAIRVQGNSMWPALKKGYLVHVHPHLPLEDEDIVVILFNDGRVKIKRFLGYNGKLVKIGQWNPPAEWTEVRADIDSIGAVVHIDVIG